MTTPNIGDIAATTIENYQATLADNVATHNPLLNEVFNRGNKTKATGGNKIRQSLMYAENGNAKFYNNLEELLVSGSDVLDAADYDWKQYNVNVVISGLDEIKNSGEQAIFNLIKSRLKVAEITAMNDIAASIFSDGTGTSGKEIGGLQLLVADDPTTGTVGSIDRSTEVWWRNQQWDFSTESVTASSTTIQNAMNTLWRRCQRNADTPDVIVFDDVYFGYYESALQNIQRITSNTMGNSGFSALEYKGVPVYYDSNCPASHGYFLNLDYLFYQVHPTRDFAMDKTKASVNQDAYVYPLYWAGNLTLSNASVQGVMKA